MINDRNRNHDYDYEYNYMLLRCDYNYIIVITRMNDYTHNNSSILFGLLLSLNWANKANNR